MVEGYCVKCKKKTEMKDTVETKTKRGVPMTKGVCTICGTKMSKFGKWNFLLLLYKEKNMKNY